MLPSRFDAWKPSFINLSAYFPLRYPIVLQIRNEHLKRRMHCVGLRSYWYCAWSKSRSQQMGFQQPWLEEQPRPWPTKQPHKQTPFLHVPSCLKHGLSESRLRCVGRPKQPTKSDTVARYWEASSSVSTFIEPDQESPLLIGIPEEVWPARDRRSEKMRHHEKRKKIKEASKAKRKKNRVV